MISHELEEECEKSEAWWEKQKYDLLVLVATNISLALYATVDIEIEGFVEELEESETT